MPRLFLVRHAMHALPRGTLAGRMPGVALSEEGKGQARALASHFARGEAVAGLRSSPVERCRQTAAVLAERLGQGVDVAEALNEIDYGEWTGRSFELLAADRRWLAWNAGRAGAAVPGGEAAVEVATRIRELFDELAAVDPGPTILVTHADVIKTAVLGLLSASLDGHDRLEIAPASITTVDLWRGGGKLVRLNQTVPT